MNATRWPSLTEFAKHLGREGICRVEEKEGEGLFIAWIDNSPEALRRQEAIRRKERQDKGDEEREQKLIRDQIERAEQAVAGDQQAEDDEERDLRRVEGEKVKLNFGSKPIENKAVSTPTGFIREEPAKAESDDSKSASPPSNIPTPPPEKVSLQMGVSNKPKNVFASVSKKNAFIVKGPAKEAPKRPMSEAERIMKEEIERRRARGANEGSGLNFKRPRLG